MTRPGKRVARLNLRSDAGTLVDEAFLAHYVVSATTAVAADDDGVRVANLGAAVQALTTGITSPTAPRALDIVGNVAGITGNVKVTGTNIAGAVIDETIALNGTTAVHGAKAFKTITKIDLPVQVHTPVQQVETATAAGTVTTAGNAAVTVTTALLEAAEAVDVPVEVDDDAAAIATAIRTALAANANVAANFTISGATDKVILTAKVPAANDATLNIAIADGSGDGASAGVSTAATSANTTAGVPYDTVKVGWNDKLGLPFLLAHNTVRDCFLNNVIEGTPATVTVSATALESNTVDLASALDGHQVDIYFYV